MDTIFNVFVSISLVKYSEHRRLGFIGFSMFVENFQALLELGSVILD